MLAGHEGMSDSDDSSDEVDEYIGKRTKPHVHRKRSDVDVNAPAESLTSSKVQEAIVSAIANMGRRISGAFLPSGKDLPIS